MQIIDPLQPRFSSNHLAHDSAGKRIAGYRNRFPSEHYCDKNRLRRSRSHDRNNMSMREVRSQVVNNNRDIGDCLIGLKCRPVIRIFQPF